MTNTIITGTVHHVALTVSNVAQRRRVLHQIARLPETDGSRTAHPAEQR